MSGKKTKQERYRVERDAELLRRVAVEAALRRAQGDLEQAERVLGVISRELSDIREALEPLADKTARVCPNCKIFTPGTEVRHDGGPDLQPRFRCLACGGSFEARQWARAYQEKVAEVASRARKRPGWDCTPGEVVEYRPFPPAFI